MITSLLVGIAVCGGCAGMEVPASARIYMEEKTLFYKDARVGDPYIHCVSADEKVLRADSGQCACLLRFTQSITWCFPVYQNGRVAEQWMMHRAKGEYVPTITQVQESDYLRALFEMRDGLAPDLDLAVFGVRGSGLFWVVHRGLVPLRVIPTDMEAWRAMTGKNPPRRNVWEIGASFDMEYALPHIRVAVWDMVTTRRFKE